MFIPLLQMMCGSLIRGGKDVDALKQAAQKKTEMGTGRAVPLRMACSLTSACSPPAIPKGTLSLVCPSPHPSPIVLHVALAAHRRPIRLLRKAVID